MVMEDVDAYVEEANNANQASDVAGNVQNPLDKILSALDGTLLRIPAPRRWTAASVGADRYRAAIGPLPIRIIFSFINFIVLVVFIHSGYFNVKYAI